MNRRTLWVTWAIVIGAAFGIVAVTHTRGVFYLVIAIIAGAGYSVIAVLTRKPPAEPGQPGPGILGTRPDALKRSGRPVGRPRFLPRQYPDHR